MMAGWLLMKMSMTTNCLIYCFIGNDTGQLGLSTRCALLNWLSWRSWRTILVFFKALLMSDLAFAICSRIAMAFGSSWVPWYSGPCSWNVAYRTNVFSVLILSGLLRSIESKKSRPPAPLFSRNSSLIESVWSSSIDWSKFLLSLSANFEIDGFNIFGLASFWGPFVEWPRLACSLFLRIYLICAWGMGSRGGRGDFASTTSSPHSGLETSASTAVAGVAFSITDFRCAPDFAVFAFF